MKRYIYVFITYCLIAVLVSGITSCANHNNNDIAVPPIEIVENPVDEIVETEPIAEEDPETAKPVEIEIIVYVDTTILSLLDDINADADSANTMWLDVNVKVAGYFGGVSEDLSCFYLISNDMNYAFESIKCNIMTEDILNDVEDRELDTPIDIYGTITAVDPVEGYIIVIDKVSE